MFELKLPPTDLTTLALWVDPHAILYVDYYKLAIPQNVERRTLKAKS